MVRINKVSLVLALVFSCSVAAAAEIRGDGEWQSLSGDAIKGSWSVSLEQFAGGVTGTLSLKGSNVFTVAGVSGTIDNGSIVLGVVVEGLREATFQGRINGQSISGEWQTKATGDYGVWSGSLGQHTADP